MVLVLSPHSFEIGDTSQLQPYAHGGFFVMVKTPKTYSFVSQFISVNNKTKSSRNMNKKVYLSAFALRFVLQETLERQLCDPQVLIPDFSKPEVRMERKLGSTFLILADSDVTWDLMSLEDGLLYFVKLNRD